ncbi:MAG: DMT family transporter [Rhodospirillales bacterium]
MRGVGSEGLGLAMAAGAACCFGLTAVQAGISYEEGNEPIALVIARFLAVVVLTYPLALLRGIDLALPLRSWGLMVGMAAGSLGIAFGYMTAIDHLPVSLAVLIFYTFPLLVTLAESLLRRRVPSTRLLIALPVGLLGLALALGAHFEGLNLYGVALGVLAALSAIPLFLCARVLAQRHDGVTLTAHCNLLGLLVAVALVAGHDEVTLPGTTLGWATTVGACLAFVAAFLLQMAAVARVTAGRVAMMSNAEPLLTILIAWAFLGQALGGVQWLGVALILGALFLVVEPQHS